MSHQTVAKVALERLGYPADRSALHTDVAVDALTKLMALTAQQSNLRDPVDALLNLMGYVSSEGVWRRDGWSKDRKVWSSTLWSERTRRMVFGYVTEEPFGGIPVWTVDQSLVEHGRATRNAPHARANEGEFYLIDESQLKALKRIANRLFTEARMSGDEMRDAAQKIDGIIETCRQLEVPR